MSEDFIFKDEFERFIDRKTREFVEHYTRKLRSELTGQVYGIATRFKTRFGIQPVIDIRVNMLEGGVEMYIHAYFDEETIARIREVLRREYSKSMEDTRARLRALKHILAYELSSHTGGVSALLSNMYSGAREGADKTGGGGAEVRAEKGGSATEGS